MEQYNFQLGFRLTYDLVSYAGSTWPDDFQSPGLKLLKTGGLQYGRRIAPRILRRTLGSVEFRSRRGIIL